MTSADQSTTYGHFASLPIGHVRSICVADLFSNSVRVFVSQLQFSCSIIAIANHQHTHVGLVIGLSLPAVAAVTGRNRKSPLSVTENDSKIISTLSVPSKFYIAHFCLFTVG